MSVWVFTCIVYPSLKAGCAAVEDGMNRHKWGPPQEVVKLCRGAVLVSTASHGGIVLSDEINRTIPEPVRSDDGCYEEDVDWAVAWVCLRRSGSIGADPEGRPLDMAAMDERARRTILDYYPDHAAALIREAADSDSLVLRERRDYADARARGWVMSIAAAGASTSNAVPPGMVGAVLAPVHPVRNEPDRTREFFAMLPESTYREARLKSGLYLFEAGEYATIGFDPFHAVENDILSPEEAFDIASSWGSLLRDGDPGAVFYTFTPGDARPAGPEHRMALIAQTRACLRTAEARIHAHEALDAGGRASSTWGDPKADLEDLRKLEAFFLRSDQRPEPIPEEPETVDPDPADPCP